MRRLECFLLLLTAAAAADWDYPNVTLTRLAFGSCHKLKYARADLWQHVAAHEPQVWLWTGDAIYPKAVDGSGIADLATLQFEFDQMKHNASIGYGTALLQRRQPLVFGSWDDHDLGANDAGVEMPDKPARAAAFGEFLDVPDQLLWQSREGTYASVTLGVPPHQVQLVLLDTRWHRDTHCIPSVAAVGGGWVPPWLGAGVACATRWVTAGLLDEWCRQQQASKTVLGEEQWTWLEQQLKKSQASLHVIVSSIQVLSTNPAMEGWGHFPAERQRLLRLLQKTTSRNSRVVLLSGDVHHGELARAAGASLLEVTSSGLTHACTHGAIGLLCRPLLTLFAAHRVNPLAYFVHRNYGTLSIDWPNRSWTVQVHDAATGQVVLSTGPQSLQTQNGAKDDDDDDWTNVPECLNGHLRKRLWPVATGLSVVGIIVLFTRRRQKRLAAARNDKDK